MNAISKVCKSGTVYGSLFKEVIQRIFKVLGSLISSNVVLIHC